MPVATFLKGGLYVRAADATILIPLNDALAWRGAENIHSIIMQVEKRSARCLQYYRRRATSRYVPLFALSHFSLYHMDLRYSDFTGLHVQYFNEPLKCIIAFYLTAVPFPIQIHGILKRKTMLAEHTT